MVQCNSGKAQLVRTIDIRFTAALCRSMIIGMLFQVIFLVNDRILAPDEQDRFAVVKLTHLVRGHQLTTGRLIVGGIASASAGGSAVGVVE